MITKLFGIIILLLLVFLAFRLFTGDKKSVGQRIIYINGYPIKVEIADTDILRSKGLSGRVSFPKDYGMLFIYQTSGYYKFWMKEIQFPLDFIWIEESKIVDITENVPPPEKDSKILPLFTSKVPADKILEVNAGLIKSYRIKVGDKINYER